MLDPHVDTRIQMYIKGRDYLILGRFATMERPPLCRRRKKADTKAERRRERREKTEKKEKKTHEKKKKNTNSREKEKQIKNTARGKKEEEEGNKDKTETKQTNSNTCLRLPRAKLFFEIYREVRRGTTIVFFSMV